MSMDFKNLFITFFYGILVVFSCQSCKDSCDTQRKFTYDLTVFNLKDTFEIGEEIIFQLIVPNNVVEENTNEIIDISDWNYLTDLSLFEIYNDSLISAYPMFEYKDSIGNFLIQIYNPDEWAVVIGLIKEKDRREFIGRITPKEPGKFIFSIAHLITDIVLPDCPNRFVNLHYNLNDESDNNYYLIESEKVKAEFTEEEMRQFGGFVFVVKE